MSSSSGLSEAGKSSLKQIAYIKDFLDYYVFIRESDQRTDPSAPLDPGMAAVFRKEGVTSTLKKLLRMFNSNPQDVKKAAKLFGLNVSKSRPRIGAKTLGRVVLKTKDGSADLREALNKIKKSNLSKKGKSRLAQILYIRDFVDYFVFLKEGDKSKGIGTPLEPDMAAVFRKEGVTSTLKKLLRMFSSNLQDVRAAADMFGLDIDESSPKLRMGAFSAAALPVKHDSTDLKKVLCQIDPTTCPAPPPPVSEPDFNQLPSQAAETLITWTPTFSQEMNSDSTDWQKANWSNGNPFNCTWQPDNISLSNGLTTLTLDKAGCPTACKSLPYASGEYRTRLEAYGYGYYEARMKAAPGSGLVTSFFVYAGTYGQPSYQEIDFEVLGKDCNQVQINYYVEGCGHHEQMIDLPSNGCENFHNYGFRWSKESIIWYIDGREVSRAQGDIPHGKTKIMVNLWPGIGVDDWLGHFTYPGSPIRAEYDWIRYSPLDRAVHY